MPRDLITYHTLMEAGRLAAAGRRRLLLGARRPSSVEAGDSIDDVVSPKDGWAVIHAMEADGIKPNEEVFNSLIFLCAKAVSTGSATLQDSHEVDCSSLGVLCLVARKS